MTWKDILKNETPRDLEVGSTNYAKDLGDSVKFIQWKDDRMNPEIPKSELNAILGEYESVLGRPIERLTQITMSSGSNEDFVEWYNKKMGIKQNPPEWMGKDDDSQNRYNWG